jgi:hypothetical protein
MIRRFAALFLVLFVLSGLPLYRVSASGEVVIGSCSSITLSGTVTPAVPIGVFVEVLSGTTPLGLVSTPAGAGGAYSVTVNFAAQPIGTVLTVTAYDPAATALYLFTTNFVCNNASSSPIFFNPGDGRVDPRPGDRLAIWCNTAATLPTIGVYGVKDDSKGVFLATINVPDLLKTKRINRALGSLGQLDVAALDANGNFYIAWTGGPYGATGQGVWAKAFNCTFPR